LPAALPKAGWRPVEQRAERPAAGALASGRLSSAFQHALPVLGVAGVAAWALLAPFGTDVAPMHLSRDEAVAAADAALAADGVVLDAHWQRLATIKSASDDAEQWTWHRFVWREAGPDAYRRLVGTTLAPPVWEVRYARFDGDVVERAEEWRVAITDDRRVRAFAHSLPESRPGARLGRDDALAIAQRALTRFAVDASALTLVAADEAQRPARTDWSFVFGDPRVAVGPGGEARYVVAVSGDAVAGVGRFVHVPEAWTRAERERDNRLQVVGLAAAALVFAAGVAALIVGILGWVRHRVDARLLRVVFATTLGVAVAAAVNAWPSVAMGLSTTEPLATQLTTKVLGGLAAALLGALLAGLCAGVGAFGARMSPPVDTIGRLPAVAAAMAAGAFVVGLQVALAALSVPDVPRWPSAGWLTKASAASAAALSGVAFVGFASLQLFVVYVVARLTGGFSRRLWLAVVIVVVLECAVALVQGRANPAGALVSGIAAGTAAAAVLLLLLRYDPRLVPAFSATIVLMTAAVDASQADAWVPYAVQAIVTAAVAAWLTRALRRQAPAA
jgi:hypothetical protein